MCSYHIRFVLSRQNTLKLNCGASSFFPPFSQHISFYHLLYASLNASYSLASVVRSASSRKATRLRVTPSEGAAARNRVREVARRSAPTTNA